ncbi:Uncharacterized protein PBTT_07551 [Plasmodiophora brassicae]
MVAGPAACVTSTAGAVAQLSRVCASGSRAQRHSDQVGVRALARCPMDPVVQLRLGDVVPGFGMKWAPEFVYQLRMKPTDHIEVVAVDLLTPDDIGVGQAVRVTLPSGVAFEIESRRQSDEDDEVQRIEIPRAEDGKPGLIVKADTWGVVGFTSVEATFRGRAVGGDGVCPIKAWNDERAPIQVEVRCKVPSYGDSLCPVQSIYYRKTEVVAENEEDAANAAAGADNTGSPQVALAP